MSEFHGDDGTYRKMECDSDESLTYYKSADGYFESYYSWTYQTYTTIYNDLYINNVADDGMSGNYYYLSADSLYEMYGTWFETADGAYFSQE